MITSNHNGLRLDGLTPGVNTHARARGVVMHGATYNGSSGVMGRSWGCPAFTPDAAPRTLNRIKGGSLFFSYVGMDANDTGPSCTQYNNRIQQQVPGWEGMCN